MRFLCGLALIYLLGAAPMFAQREIRARPPLTLDCQRGRDHLTAYTGVVVKYVRGAARTSLQISTDWGTTEDIAIDHKGSDPAKWFLYRGKAFIAADWEKITDAAGRLRRNTRATAWVCDNGSNPVVDWDAPKE
jgi:hypothetical protein